MRINSPSQSGPTEFDAFRYAVLSELETSPESLSSTNQSCPVQLVLHHGHIENRKSKDVNLPCRNPVEFVAVLQDGKSSSIIRHVSCLYVASA